MLLGITNKIKNPNNKGFSIFKDFINWSKDGDQNNFQPEWFIFNSESFPTPLVIN